MTFLEELKQSSHYPIYEIFDEKGWLGFRGQFCGRWDDYGDGKLGHVGEKLELQANMSDIEKEATLIHELGHARCSKRQCECMLQTNRTGAELHAELYALHFLLKHHRKQALRFRINILHPRWSRLSAKYSDAMLVLKTRKIYKRCLDFIGEDEDLLRKHSFWYKLIYGIFSRFHHD